MVYLDIDVTIKKNFAVNMLVDIRVEGTEEEKRGYIKKILSSSNNKKGIKVLLYTGEQGRIIGIPSKIEMEKEQFKYYNLLFNTCKICTIVSKKENEYFILEYQGKRFLYLFSDREIADKLLKGNEQIQRQYHVRPVKRTQLLTSTFRDAKVDYFVLDTEKQLTPEQLDYWEKKFKNC